MDQRRSTSSGRAAVSRRNALLGLASLGCGAALSGCRLAVDEARGASSGGGPRRGGTLRMAVLLDPDPSAAQSQMANSLTWRRLVFEPLTSYGEDGSPRPRLATGWEFSEGGRVVTLHLRENVLLHSGRPMDARDVMYSLRRPAGPAAASQARSIASLVTDLSADDPLTVRMRLRRPASNLFDLFELAGIMDHESADGVDDGSSMIGTGPFVWESWTPGATLRLARNPRYRVAGRPFLDRIEQSTIGDPTALVTAIRGNRAHIAYGTSPLDAKGLSEDDRFAVNPSSSVAYAVGMDVTAAPFTDRRVRQAIGYAIDRDRILSQVFAGYGYQSSLWWSRSDSGWNEEQSHAYSYDPGRARSMIAAAGAAGTQVVLNTRSLASVRSMAEIVRYNLEDAGLRVHIKVIDSVDFNERLAKAQLSPMFINGHGLADLSASTFISSVPAFLPSGNSSKFRSATYRDATRALLTATPDERNARLRTVAGYMQKEAFNHCLLVAPLVSVLARRLRGVRQTRMGAFLLDDAYLV